MIRLALLCVFIIATHAAAEQVASHSVLPGRPSTAESALTLQVLVGLTVKHGVLRIEALGDRSSCPVQPWSKQQTEARVRRMDVKFPTSFTQTPAVTYSLTTLDMDRNYNARYNITIVEASSTGFGLEFKVWCNTYVYSAEVTFWAFGVAAGRASSGSVLVDDDIDIDTHF